uniref:Uncharacterized protein n=1 Tax=Aegilops tauschii subsp. strangulata TaxID=200361 RepID=A0A453PAE6_AEGTS
MIPARLVSLRRGPIILLLPFVEGETSTRQMELDLSDYLATGWRCSAHAIGPGVFVVRFPNPRAVAQIFYVGNVTLKTSGAVIHATQWSSAVGSKGIMEVAWVRVINVPLDKRSERNIAFVASLVGVPLEIDTATLHRPASVRVKLGCRNVDAIPGIAESVLGGHFYDFAYEVEQVLIRDPNRGKNEIRVPPNSDEGNHKKTKQDVNPGAQRGSTSTGLGGKSLPIPQREVPGPIQESQESIESDDSLHTTLIETMKYEHEQGVKEKVSTSFQQVLMRPNPEYKERVKTYSDVVKSLP